ncbi:hypothetical protein IE53DRAFT_71418 [Violaceomyces palustris]|uniref:Uncharacterized protein n=1 Tax=Violaceomyces palustris TaxID=1673888 RepID=A0ACD0P7A7_9BASI|nr:hypothetical protein IE53DRAFT_71418 [Violaceomyces palustris]
MLAGGGLTTRFHRAACHPHLTLLPHSPLPTLWHGLLGGVVSLTGWRRFLVVTFSRFLPDEGVLTLADREEGRETPPRPWICGSGKFGAERRRLPATANPSSFAAPGISRWIPRSQETLIAIHFHPFTFAEHGKIPFFHPKGEKFHRPKKGRPGRFDS